VGKHGLVTEWVMRLRARYPPGPARSPTRCRSHPDPSAAAEHSRDQLESDGDGRQDRGRSERKSEITRCHRLTSRSRVTRLTSVCHIPSRFWSMSRVVVHRGSKPQRSTSATRPSFVNRIR
jgi:hypothetical protein